MSVVTYETENSTYEVEYEGKRPVRVRRRRGPVDVVHSLANNTWHDLESVTSVGGRTVFTFPDGRSVMTSPALSLEGRPS